MNAQRSLCDYTCPSRPGVADASEMHYLASAYVSGLQLGLERHE